MTTSEAQYILSIAVDEDVDRDALYDINTMKLVLESKDEWIMDNPTAEFINEKMLLPYMEQFSKDNTLTIDESYPSGMYAVYFNNLRQEFRVDLEDAVFKKAFETNSFASKSANC